MLDPVQEPRPHILCIHIHSTEGVSVDMMRVGSYCNPFLLICQKMVAGCSKMDKDGMSAAKE